MNRVLQALGNLSTDEARERARNILRRFNQDLIETGGIDRINFLDMTNEDFNTVVRTLFRGKLAQ